jgi:lysyl-tRNA synthetase class 2
LYRDIRDFFCSRAVLEVETPILGRSTATDPFLASIPTAVTASPGETPQKFYLHTSPEFPMKRLVTAGSGAIYQIVKAFRDGESSRKHNPEFTLLEWYQPGYQLDDLMAEVELLTEKLTGLGKASRRSYRQAFLDILELDPFTVADQNLRQVAQQVCGFSGMVNDLSRDDLLNLILGHCIEPHLGQGGPEFLYHYPPSQASLAKLTQSDGCLVAERFELYIRGLEIANGYHELTDAREQRQRFEGDNRQRRSLSLPEIPPDENLIAALQAGMPSCSGVALGLDRLLMIIQGVDSIQKVLAFPIDRV